MKKPRKKRAKKPKHTTVVRAFSFLIEESYERTECLRKRLNLCVEIRNILALEREQDRLAQRKVREAGGKPKYLTRADQYKRVSELLQNDRRFSGLHSQVAQNIADRIDAGNKRWLEALSEGRTRVKPPKQIEAKRYRSFTYPQYGPSANLHNGILHLSKLGDFKVRAHRKIRGRPKTVTIVFKQGRWWAVITCEIQEKDICRTLEEVAHLSDTGGDPGLENLLTTAQGVVHDPPKALKDSLSKLHSEQRAMNRKFEARKKKVAAENIARKARGEAPIALKDAPRSKRLVAQIKVVAKSHTKVARVRDYHHKRIARQIECSHSRVAVEEHGVQFMMANRRTARAASDRAIGAFKQKLKSALGEERYFAGPTSRPGIGGNSQTCLCGASVPKKLSDRIHSCPACGLTAPRDQVSANIVMGVAFGHTHLQSGTGQVFVRRREPQTDGAVPSRECESTSEASLKRQIHSFPRPKHTADAKATPEVKTPDHLRRKPDVGRCDETLGLIQA